MRYSILTLLTTVALVAAQNGTPLDPRPQSQCTSIQNPIQCYLPNGDKATTCCDSAQGDTMCCGTGCASADLPCVVMPNDDVKVCFAGEDCGQSGALTGSKTSTATKAYSRSSTASSESATSSSKATTAAAPETAAPTTSSSAAGATQMAGIAAVAMAVGGMLVGL